MKKNININMFGVIYAIDEDAYELLKKYLENMRSYYSHRRLLALIYSHLLPSL